MKTKIKYYIKNIYYSSVGRCIRKIPEQIVFTSRYKDNLKNLIEINKRFPKKIINIVFILEMPQVWNSCKTVFEAFEEMNDVNAYILALPKYPNTEINPAFEFARPLYDNVINGYDTDKGNWFDLKKIEPDFVFYTRPYHKEYPERLKPSYTSKFAKLCYIPYGFEFVTGYHLEVEYNNYFLPYLSYVFCEGKASKNYCQKKCSKTDIKLLEFGYPRFDLLKPSEFDGRDSVKTVLWTPRWSVEKLANDGTSYFDYIDLLLDYFEKHKNVVLIVRPHPLMFNNFIRLGILTKKDIDNVVEKIRKTSNIVLDENTDYLESIRKADLIISDFSSMLIEFLAFDKPVIYTGRTDSFDDTGCLMESAMYHVSDYDSVIEAMNSILQNDYKRSVRVNVRSELRFDSDYHIGKKIADYLVSECKR